MTVSLSVLAVADPHISTETILPRITPTIRHSKRQRRGTKIPSLEMEFHKPFRCSESLGLSTLLSAFNSSC